MTNKERLQEIEDRWSTFKHWTEKQMIREKNDTLYADSAGLDVEWLIARVKSLTEALEQINKSNYLKNISILTSFPAQNAAVWEIQIIARKALEDEE